MFGISQSGNSFGFEESLTQSLFYPYCFFFVCCPLSFNLFTKKVTSFLPPVLNYLFLSTY